MSRMDYVNWQEASDDLHALAERRSYSPADCPHCAYDRRFPDFETGGWMQQDNNGPIVSCPVCNPDGKHPRR